MIGVKIGSEDCIEVGIALAITSDSGQSISLKVPINPLHCPNVRLDWQRSWKQAIFAIIHFSICSALLEVGVINPIWRGQAGALWGAGAAELWLGTGQCAWWPLGPTLGSDHWPLHGSTAANHCPLLNTSLLHSQQNNLIFKTTLRLRFCCCLPFPPNPEDFLFGHSSKSKFVSI